jgi:hypothetical protein
MPLRSPEPKACSLFAERKSFRWRRNSVDEKDMSCSKSDMNKAILAFAALALAAPAAAQTLYPDPEVYPDREDVRRRTGYCLPGSGIRSGTLDEDLTLKPKRPFQCNLLQVQANAPRVVFSFSQFADEEAPLYAFEGRRIDSTNFEITYLHYGAVRMKATEGHCELFYEKGMLVSLSCGGHAVRDGSQYVLLAGFVVR